MVMALSAAISQTHKDGAYGVGNVIQQLLAPEFNYGLVIFIRILPQKAHRNLRVQVVRIELVASDLFADEAVVGFVAVERIDHVIAVAPDVRPDVVGLEAVRIGVARQIQPLAAPTLAIARRSQ